MTSTPAASGPPDAVIWTRAVDRARHERRVRAFVLYYVVPVSVIAVAVAVFGGVGPALGVLILAGLFGLLLGGWVWLTNINERSNATIRLRGDDLVLGKRRVPVTRVVSFTTVQTRISGPYIDGVRSSIEAGVALFDVDDGSRVEFLWPSMPAEHLIGVRAALETVLPGRYTPPTS